MNRLASVLPLIVAAFILPVAGAAVEVDSETFGNLRARSIGPAEMGGRIAAIDAVPGPPLTVYVGAASGGVWKSVDGAVSFEPIFDDHPQSIGAIKVDPSASDVVWVGTGESWVRNSVSVGRGVFKSTDGGETWQDVGLHDSERIGAIRIDPTDGDVIYVCATGHLWDANEERGLYKTTDGGTSWEKVLYVDPSTGCADLDLDPQDPSILYAAMWQFRRYPDFFNSGGPGSGLYKSTDGGASWKRLEKGLPRGDLGRIAVAVAPSRPSVVYATVEAEETALYRSEDLGETWRRVNDSPNVRGRPFYLSELVVDPTDHRRVYKPGLFLTISTDGGESFSGLLNAGTALHSDHHALWIHPRNPHLLLLGTDGGLYVSNDRGTHWRYARSLPISQFYHVSHDLEWPYNVYGGLQDNFSWKGPSRRSGGIRNRDWESVGTGDGSWVFPDREDSNLVYVEYQGGQLFRLDVRLGELKSIKPIAEPGQPPLRFNWNSPIELGVHHPGTLYFGSQFLHRSRDRGESWQTVSPDLSTDDPRKQRQHLTGGLTIDNTTAENHCTIYTISESPLDAAVVWVGTDDGQLHVTRDEAMTWTNVVANVPDLPPLTSVSSIDASPHAEGTALVTFDGHRTGDMAAYVYRTDDYGASWTSLATPEIDAFAWVIKQDPVNPDLLYLGTEMGLFLTLDGGRRWARFKGNLPMVAVHDLAIHPTEHDVVLGTHGRGIYVIDDVTPLRALTPEILDSDVALLPSRPARLVATNLLLSLTGDEEFIGETLEEAAPITYYLKKRHLFGDLKVEILDDAGEVIASLPAPKRRGLNRVHWPMRLKPPEMPGGTNLVAMYLMPGAFLGPRALEGTYRVRLTKGKKVLTGEVTLVADPRSPHSAADRRAQQELALDLYHRLNDLTYLTTVLADLRDQSRDRARALRRSDARRLQGFADRLEALRGELVSTSDAGFFSGEEQLREHLAGLYAEVLTYDGRPSPAQFRRRDALAAELEAAEKKVEEVLGSDLGALNALLRKRGGEALERQSREAWEAGKGAP